MAKKVKIKRKEREKWENDDSVDNQPTKEKKRRMKWEAIAMMQAQAASS